jgi:hypothetical protein
MPDRQRLLEMALKGLQADRARIEQEIAEIKRELGRSSGGTDDEPRKRRRMSAAARKKISEAMKRRYAEMRRAMKK